MVYPYPSLRRPAINVGASPTAVGDTPEALGDTTPTVTFAPLGSLETAVGPQPGQSSSPSSDGNSDGGDSSSIGGPNTGHTSGTLQSPSPTPSHHSELPKAAIAIIAVVASLFVLSLLVVITRRCSVARRLSRRRKWFRPHPQNVYGATGVSSSGYFRQNAASIRSSFGTSYENELPLPSPDPMPNWPLPQPMVQTTNSPITFPPAAPTASSAPVFTIRNRDSSDSDSFMSGSRLSMHSDNSGHSVLPQILLVPDRRVVITESQSPIDLTTDIGSPISVRPFSPTERWSFPQPPKGDFASSVYATPLAVSPSPDSFATSDYVTAQEHHDPFADPEEAHTMETFMTTDTVAVHFQPIETIYRPFVPTMDDEMAVNPGDSVHVLTRFDDGWGYAENRTTGHRGLFPIDCLRMANQDLPAFLAQKRLSSYVVFRPPSRASSISPRPEHYAI
ncbi:hypothetical protein NM688_g6057 [Phlebia brevispora]|uniref:Uncharacterized protein n=1 Tax=Phlebia brevispora TaxID=194682 RepID=A0ACC1SKE0_9APHY|nr:hypothetical protein NM688_g6057 [Phlebia brevispora]